MGMSWYACTFSEVSLQYFQIRKDVHPPPALKVPARAVCDWYSGQMQPAAEVLLSAGPSVWETRKTVDKVYFSLLR